MGFSLPVLVAQSSDFMLTARAIGVGVPWMEWPTREHNGAALQFAATTQGMGSTAVLEEERARDKG